jgi:hypothetical protein
MDESLVREIVARILADSRFQALVAGVSQNESVLKPAALVVADSEAAVALLPELQERWGGCCSLQVFLGAPVEAAKVALPRRSFQEAMTEPSWSRLLIPVCSGPQLAEIALGLRGTPLAALAAEAILRGIPVEIGRVDFAFMERTPVAYRKLFEEYAQRVAAYGVTIGTKTVPAALPAAPTPAVVPPAPSAPAVVKEAAFRPEVLFDKKLMTEKEAVLLPEQAVLNLNRGTILTPAAIDVLKQLRVQVYREGVRFL